MEQIPQTKRQPARRELIVLVLGCTSLFIATVGIIMTGLGTTMLAVFVGFTNGHIFFLNSYIELNRYRERFVHKMI
jgi:hypothetical protein